MGLPFASVPMDWSRKDGGAAIADLAPNCSGQNLDFPNAFIIVHGAGWWVQYAPIFPTNNVATISSGFQMTIVTTIDVWNDRKWQHSHFLLLLTLISVYSRHGSLAFLDHSLWRDLNFRHLCWAVVFCMIGAGSYGHFQASKSGVNKGDLKNPLVKAGFVATRISVSARLFDILVTFLRLDLKRILCFTCR